MVEGEAGKGNSAGPRTPCEQVLGPLYIEELALRR